MAAETVLALVPGISLLALVVAGGLARQALRADAGRPEMWATSEAIRDGAETFLARQYRTIGVLSVLARRAILAFSHANRHVPNTAAMGEGADWTVTVSFVTGGLCSARLYRDVRVDPGQHPPPP